MLAASQSNSSQPRETSTLGQYGNSLGAAPSSAPPRSGSSLHSTASATSSRISRRPMNPTNGQGISPPPTISWQQPSSLGNRAPSPPPIVMTQQLSSSALTGGRVSGFGVGGQEYDYRPPSSALGGRPRSSLSPLAYGQEQHVESDDDDEEMGSDHRASSPTTPGQGLFADPESQYHHQDPQASRFRHPSSSSSMMPQGGGSLLERAQRRRETREETYGIDQQQLSLHAGEETTGSSSQYAAAAAAPSSSYGRMPTKTGASPRSPNGPEGQKSEGPTFCDKWKANAQAEQNYCLGLFRLIVAMRDEKATQADVGSVKKFAFAVLAFAVAIPLAIATVLETIGRVIVLALAYVVYTATGIEKIKEYGMDTTNKAWKAFARVAIMFTETVLKTWRFNAEIEWIDDQRYYGAADNNPKWLRQPEVDYDDFCHHSSRASSSSYGVTAH